MLLRITFTTICSVQIQHTKIGRIHLEIMMQNLCKKIFKIKKKKLQNKLLKTNIYQIFMQSDYKIKIIKFEAIKINRCLHQLYC